MPLSKTLAFLVIIQLLPLSLLTAAEQRQKSKPLPEPLTLDLALSLIDQQHPFLRSADADLKIVNSNLQQAQSNNDLTLNFKATARYISPSSLAGNQSNEDHRLGLIVNKTIYDFGRNATQIESALNKLTSQKLQYLNAQQQQYIDVMTRYFNVVLADLQFYRYNEEMAVAYIRFDRMQIRAKLGQFTDLEVIEKEMEYERIRRLRTFSSNQQRVTRSLLARSLNRPDDLPETLARPELNVVSRKLPDFEILQKSIKINNPTLRALRAKLVAAKNNVQFAHASDNPSLSAGFETYSYVRETSGTDKWRATMTLDVPLWNGGRIDAVVAKAKANVYKVEAELTQQEYSLSQKALELWLGIKTLKVKHDEVLAGMDFAELSLDKNRALYELEVRGDLGYSMVKFSAAERKVVQNNFDLALAWAQLDALTGALLKDKNKI